MRPAQARVLCFTIALTATTLAPARAQVAYAGVGLGPAILMDDQPAGTTSTDRATSGVVGLEWPNRIGLRLAGTETYGYVWASADLTYQLGPRSWPLRPYALAGAGLRMDLDDSDPVGIAGAGARVHLTGLLSLFGESRVHHILSPVPVYSHPTIPGTFRQRTFLVITFGISLAP